MDMVKNTYLPVKTLKAAWFYADLTAGRDAKWSNKVLNLLCLAVKPVLWNL